MGQSKKDFMEQREAELAPEYKTPKSQGLSISSAKFLDLDKGAIRDLAMAVVSEYTDGFKSPAEGLLLAKKLEELSTQLKDNLKDHAASELKLAKGEKANVHGAVVTEQMTGVKYDFKVCNSPRWDRLKAEITAEENFLKTVVGTKEVLYEETGEVAKVSQPAKSGSMSLIFKY